VDMVTEPGGVAGRFLSGKPAAPRAQSVTQSTPAAESSAHCRIAPELSSLVMLQARKFASFDQLRGKRKMFFIFSNFWCRESIIVVDLFPFFRFFLFFFYFSFLFFFVYGLNCHFFDFLYFLLFISDFYRRCECVPDDIIQ
jgi:hypothetical protein